MKESYRSKKLYRVEMFAVLLVLWSLASSVAATTPLPPHATLEFRARVVANPSTPVGYVKMDLPQEAFAHLKSDLSDLRVSADGGLMVPYVVAIEREASAFVSVPARMTNLSSQNGEMTSFILDMGRSGLLHNRITIETSSENFRRKVIIDGSDDQMSWRTLNPAGQIFDYTVRDIKPVSVEDMNVSYPDATFRYLRVTISDAGESPLKVIGARVARMAVSGAREVSYSPLISTRQDTETKSTVVVLDLGAEGIPHRRGQVRIDGNNFHRSVAIYDSDAPGDDASWRLLSNAYVFSIDTPKFSGSNTEFSYPESNKRYLKLVISNGDDAPVSVNAATLYGVVRSIIFLYDPSKEYMLYLGDPAAIRPQYDLSEILQYVESSDLDRVQLAALENNPYFVAPKIPKPPITERSPYALPVVLGLVVAVLAFLLFRVVGHAASLPPVNQS
ncbi:MAG: hypothetical protein A2756_02865 [Candidatus Ryanbacteria bacterium RIFCSPHIGHO2_01_FULL_48_27]|uniref:DUF3999 domain-containing protein n=1 Tax=Candidatus Ryanbacteria bacterium RIFCSPHIGHO2_01_FULL_48_27 TaxID=1802115 RepID=A0A1G2G6K3_9BACT|nr:MAG: hypothetical protein A2756_02865 [Candidatus Ryanbacteria bacterium RIFCSPHIGHO2_01_FULL_48_27]